MGVGVHETGGIQEHLGETRPHALDIETDRKDEPRPRPIVLRLQEGRALACIESGDPAGTPLLEFHGLPSPRLAQTISDKFLRDRGIRRVTVDRPGVGFSDPQPGRTLLDWPQDVAEAVDALGIERFAILGVSGGAPHALACARGLPDRVTAVGLVSGIGPLDRSGAFEGMNRSAARVMIVARRAPWLARPVVGFAVGVDRLRPGTLLRGLLKALPVPDQAVASRPEVRESLLESYALAFRQGTSGQGAGLGDPCNPLGIPSRGREGTGFAVPWGDGRPCSLASRQASGAGHSGLPPHCVSGPRTHDHLRAGRGVRKSANGLNVAGVPLESHTPGPVLPHASRPISCGSPNRECPLALTPRRVPGQGDTPIRAHPCSGKRHHQGIGFRMARDAVCLSASGRGGEHPRPRSPLPRIR